MRRLGDILLCLLPLLAGARTPLAAQVGVTTDILTGTVTDTSGTPVSGATVEAVSLEVGHSRQAVTDAKGRYRILFPDGGGRYLLVVRQIGMTPARRQVERVGDEDRLVADFRLTPQAVELEELTVAGRRQAFEDLRPTPGSTEMVQTPDRLARLPLDAGDLNAIAALAAGVVSLSGTDSTAASFSVAGQRSTANSTTLDGLSFGASSIPQDAVRSTRVITNTYDVSRGQFSGGLIASTTRSGTRVFQGTANGSLRDPALAVVPDSVTNQPQSQQQLSFGVGGPIITNRLFAFGAGQVRHRGNDLITALTLADGGADRYGVAQDSLDRYTTILSGLGVPFTTGAVPDSRSGTDWSGIGRLDLLLGDAHTLTVRGDFRQGKDAPSRLAPLSLPAAGGRTENRSGGAMIQLSSRLGQSLLNEAKVYVAGSRNRGDPYVRMPAGRVQLSSTLDDGTLSASVLSFGGNAGFPQRGHGTSFETTDEMSWLSADAAHRVKLGLFYTTARTTQQNASNQLGTFTFQTLDDLAAGRPLLFTRTLGTDERTGRSSTAAAYLGDTWRFNRSWQLTYGVRGEHSWFGNAPPYNAAVDSVFGLRTDRLPVETHLSPRAGFTWTPFPAEGPPTWVVRGGFGEFRSPVPAQLAVAAQAASGTGNGQTQLVCAGSAAPTPDWAAMAADPAAIPTSCAGGLPGGPRDDLPSITAFAPGFTAPRVWRGSLGAQRRSGLLSYGLDLGVGVGVSQQGFRDRNIGASQFSLGDEGGRLVYAPATAFDSATGASPLLASRLDPNFGQVFEAISTLTTRSAQAVFTFGGIIGHGITVFSSYTLSHTTDESSSGEFGGGRGFAAQTAGRQLYSTGRSVSDFDRRHQLVTTVTVPVAKGFEITGIGRVSSGTPYTPSVAGDINGDGSRNDRAFIFDPASATDPAVAAAMTRLLHSSSGRVRACLEKQLGTIADRNSCRGPWQPSFDLQLNWRPTVLGLDQRLTISLLTSNLLAGLDQLFHDDNNLHGWGQFTRPDPTLLTVRGFDPATQAFVYDVNERFGDIRGTQTFRQPFQIGIQMRMQLGQRSLFGGGPGGIGGGPRGPGGPGGFGGGRPGGFGGGPPAGGPPPGADGGGPPPQGGAQGGAPTQGGPPAAQPSFADRIVQTLRDPVAPIIALSIPLKLTDEQLGKLQAVSDSFTAARDSVAKGIQKEINGMGADPDRAVLFTAIRRHMEGARDLSQAYLDKAHALLTPAQWDALPDEAKAPPRFFGGPPRNRN